jgi:hypothetical protein
MGCINCIMTLGAGIVAAIVASIIALIAGASAGMAFQTVAPIAGLVAGIVMACGLARTSTSEHYAAQSLRAQSGRKPSADEIKIELRRRLAKDKDFDSKALEIIRAFGADGRFVGGGLEITRTDSEGDFATSWSYTIKYNSIEVYSVWHRLVTHALDRYGRRYEIGDDEDRPYGGGGITGYIPGAWETILEKLYADAKRKQKESYQAALRPSPETKRRFGL